MPSITLTEALQEIKTIGKKLEVKRGFVRQNIGRQAIIMDPMQSAGGQVNVVKSELQAIDDLEQRRVNLRRAIQRANDSTTITIAGTERSISDWLVWRREVAPTRQQFYTTLKNEVDNAKKQASQRIASAGNPEINGVIINLDEAKLQKEVEKLDETLSVLDGQLSLKNATVTVEV